MIVVTGLSVTVLILSRIAWPVPGFFVSTMTRPLAVVKPAVFPPAPVIIHRLSLTFLMSSIGGPAGPRPRPSPRPWPGAPAGGFWNPATAIDNAPTATSVLNRTGRFMGALLAKPAVTVSEKGSSEKRGQACFR